MIIDGTVRSAGETGAGIFKEDGRAYVIGESPTAGVSSSKETITLALGPIHASCLGPLEQGAIQRGQGYRGGRGSAPRDREL